MAAGNLCEMHSKQSWSLCQSFSLQALAELLLLGVHLRCTSHANAHFCQDCKVKRGYAKICKASIQGQVPDLAVEALLDVGDVLLDLLCSLSIHLHSKCA